MQSIHEFMQSYFRERVELRKGWLAHSTPFRRKFFTPEYSTEHYNSEEEIRSFARDTPPSVLSVDDSASAVITTEPFGKRHRRRRYHLQPSGETWFIRRCECECFMCKGTGKSGREICKNCDGIGWKHYGPSDA